LDEARRVLGVDAHASTDEIRDAYRRLLRTHHPDVAGPAGTATAARVIEAYAIVRTGPPADAPAPPTAASADRIPRPTDPGPHPTDPNDGLGLAAPARTVFEQLCEAADVLGDLGSVDVQHGIVETIVTWDGWPACSLLVTLEQRGDTTLAQCDLESLDGRPGPPIGKVVAELRRIMDALAE
jgi:hypothetical protein